MTVISSSLTHLSQSLARSRGRVHNRPKAENTSEERKEEVPAEEERRAEEDGCEGDADEDERRARLGLEGEVEGEVSSCPWG
ncbi:hypothetical protein NLJ89_g11853 [Agrocybe chaxingu]|uniref:Uncharacterized protein n=1 Tax=Agrocybe chaxingu TaxID=84603 RepID=A0A9W8JMZ5_9AGAR|nr:hypothetical protein NLJ89_g11853 [Agrocybe chaxingu]